MNKHFSIITVCVSASCWIVALLPFTCSCTEPVQKEKHPDNGNAGHKPGIVKKPPSSFDDTITIDRRSAVFYSPDSMQMKRIKAVNENVIFETITHNCYYQMQNARIMLEKYWPQIRMIETSRARYLLFVKRNKSKICIDLNNKNNICGIFLFDEERDPVVVDMPNINTALGFYFRK